METHSNVQLHFIPTYSSWFNKVELSLDKIERDRSFASPTSREGSCDISVTTTGRPGL